MLPYCLAPSPPLKDSSAIFFKLHSGLKYNSLTIIFCFNPLAMYWSKVVTPPLKSCTYEAHSVTPSYNHKCCEGVGFSKLKLSIISECIFNGVMT